MAKSGTLYPILFAAAAAPLARGDEPEDARHSRVQVGQWFAHEDNLYRLPGGIEPRDLLGGAGNRGAEVHF